MIDLYRKYTLRFAQWAWQFGPDWSLRLAYRLLVEADIKWLEWRFRNLPR